MSQQPVLGLNNFKFFESVPVCCRCRPGACRSRQPSWQEGQRGIRQPILHIPVCFVGGAMVYVAPTCPSKQQCKALVRKSFSPQSSLRLVSAQTGSCVSP